jgi:hypothetical protein
VRQHIVPDFCTDARFLESVTGDVSNECVKGLSVAFQLRRCVGLRCCVSLGVAWTVSYAYRREPVSAHSGRC